MFDVVRVELLCSSWCVPPQPMPPIPTHSLSLNTLGRGNERGRRLRARGFINLTSQSMPRIARSLLVSHLPSGAVLVAPLVRVCALRDSRTPNLEPGEPLGADVDSGEMAGKPPIHDWRAAAPSCLQTWKASGAGDEPFEVQCSHDGGGYFGRLPRRIDNNSQQRRARNSLFTSLLRLSLKPRGERLMRGLPTTRETPFCCGGCSMRRGRGQGPRSRGCRRAPQPKRSASQCIPQAGTERDHE